MFIIHEYLIIVNTLHETDKFSFCYMRISCSIAAIDTKVVIKFNIKINNE